MTAKPESTRFESEWERYGRIPESRPQPVYAACARCGAENLYRPGERAVCGYCGEAA